MIRRYCDACGNLITQSATGRRIRREHYIEPGKVIDIEITVAWNKTWNSGDLCAPCVLRAAADGQDVEP